MSQPEGRGQQDHDLQLTLALEPFTLVIELDAWNIRERDAWGRSKALRQKGERTTSLALALRRNLFSTQPARSRGSG